MLSTEREISNLTNCLRRKAHTDVIIENHAFYNKARDPEYVRKASFNL